MARLFEVALVGKMGHAQLHRELKAIAPQGTTQGSLFVAAGYRELPVLQ